MIVNELATSYKTSNIHNNYIDHKYSYLNAIQRLQQMNQKLAEELKIAES